MKRRFLLIVACAALAGLAVMVPMRGAEAAATDKRIALLVGPTEDKYIGTWAKTFDAAATKDGMKVTTFATPFDPALQAQQVDDAIAQKFDMIVVQTISQKAIVPALTRAKAAKIPVVLIISQFPEGENADLYVSYVGARSDQLGELAGVAMGNALKASGRTKAKVAILAGSMAEGIAPVRVAAFRKAMANFPGYDIVQVEDVMWQPPIAERAAGQLLARFAAQGGLDAFYGMNDVVANAAVQAANSAGVAVGTGPGQLIVVGGNCQAPGIKNIESGKMAATVFMDPTEEAKLTVQKVGEFFDGKDIGKASYTHHEIITKENVAKFAAACSY